MKFRRSAPKTLFLLAIAFGVAWLTRRYWQPLLSAQFDTIADNAALLEGLDAILGIGSVLLTGLSFLLFYRQREQDPASEPIRAITVDELRKPYGRGGKVNWIDRQLTHPDLLASHRRPHPLQRQPPLKDTVNSSNPVF